MAINTFLKHSFLVCLLAVNSYAFDWNIFKYNLGFNMFIMDHEGSTPYWVNTNTNLKTRLTPNFGIQFYTKGVEQSLTVGAYFFQNFHNYSTNFPYRWGPTMYYKARGKRFTFYGGIFPRKNLLGRYGLNIFAPYYWFIDPNARGFLLQFQNHYSPSKPYYGHAEFMLDWFGGNCYNTCKFGRNPYGNAMDRFQMNGSVGYHFFKDLLGIGGNFVLFHNEDKYLLNGADGMQFNEKKAIDNNNIYLMDRLYFNAYIGTSLLDIAPFMEKLNASFGMVSESSRLRQIHKNVPFMNSVGGQLDVEIQYKGFGIHNLFFFAKTPEMPFYNQYQYVEMYCTPSYCPTPIYRGVPFFQANMYNRFDLYYNWKNDFASVRINFVLNAMRGGFDRSLPWSESYQVYMTVAFDPYNLINKIARKK
ncbi:hypothetical protein KVM14_03485 [Helicobacter pylori]|nr:hypothetical protein KVM14_03485 [Helicobacter pylori]